ncbi:MAG TPA: hypothetical protein VGI75_16040 [Pirellulales bacterium]
MKYLNVPVLFIVALTAEFSARAADDAEFLPIDLKPYSNQKLDDAFGPGLDENNLKHLPKGESVFEDCNFEIGEGLIQLGSTALKQTLTEKVEGIKVDRKLTKLHFLHATQCGGGPNKSGDPWYVEDDTLVGEYRVNFSDRSAVIIPIAYGVDVRDWFFVEGEKEPSRSKVVWTGDNDYAHANGARIRLYETTWENPWPGKTVTSIDFSAKKNETPAAPFCVAITSEGPARKMGARLFLKVHLGEQLFDRFPFASCRGHVNTFEYASLQQ